MPKTEEAERLLEEGAAGSGWPVQQPSTSPNYLFCCPWIVFVPIFGIVFFVVVAIVLYLVLNLAWVVGLIVGLPVSFALVYYWFWRCCPGYWPTDLYEKVIYTVHMLMTINAAVPNAGPEFMPVSGLRPREELPKGLLDYALFLQVPYGSSDEFELSSETALEQSLTFLPQSQHLETFGPDENPVEFVMNQLSSIYPPIYQEWPDKLSDTALVRFCLHGLGAHRVGVEIRDGRKLFVIKTNALSGLPVREGFERYGGDMYFDKDWKPVMIIDAGQGPLRQDGPQERVTTKPGEAGWERAKFRFRSSVFTLVTLVDHLYDIHLQKSNLFVTAMREHMSSDHPVRRFMTPFMYRTITVNDNAFHNLLTKNGMAPRCFAFTDNGFGLALAAGPSLLMDGTEVPVDAGGPILFRSDYVDYLKRKGIDTVYWKQVSQLFQLYLRFVLAYLECYYPKKEDFANDPEMLAVIRQYFYQLETAGPNTLSQKVDFTTPTSSARIDEKYRFYAMFLAEIMFWVTAGHEQAGAVEVYAQDASWCAFRWVPGATVGTKQSATATALLMSFTSQSADAEALGR
ncbi:LOX1 [Symbiodinium sp. CCMP2456]|nr:LOX1 [Symbiodinium sp. CCMP2456]